MRMVIQTLPINRNNGKTRCLTDKTTPNNGGGFLLSLFGVCGRFNPLESQEVKTVFCCPPYRYAGVFAADAVFYWSVKDEIEIG